MRWLCAFPFIKDTDEAGVEELAQKFVHEHAGSADRIEIVVTTERGLAERRMTFVPSRAQYDTLPFGV